MTTTMKRLALGIGATIVALGVAGGAYVHAQNTPATHSGAGRFGGPGRGGPGQPGGLLGPAFHQLNLTDAQQTRIKEIVDSHRDEMRALGDKARAAHQALEAATTGPTFDESTVRTKAAD